MNAVQYSNEVDLHDLQALLEGHLLEKPSRSDAGVVEQKIECSTGELTHVLQWQPIVAGEEDDAAAVSNKPPDLARAARRKSPSHFAR